jgi:outer membrane receptor for ferrienterochelin and colicins
MNFIAWFTVLLCAVACSVQAQTVRVINSVSAEEIPGAVVLLTAADGHVRQGVTDLKGTISFAPVSSTQRLQVRMTGFITWNDSLSANCETTDVLLVPKSDSLGEVVITGQYGEVDPAATVQPVRVINRERIDAQGAQTLNDVLSTELNIRRSQDQVLGSSMSVQGLSGENVKILVDGVPMIGRLNGSIDLSQISLSNVERIEIVEGPLSVNYGTNALAGAVNLITKRTQGNTFSVQSDNYYESSGNYNFTGRIGGRYRNTIVSLSGGRNFFDGWSPWHKPFYVDWQPLADSTRYDSWKPREQLFASLYAGHYYNRGSFGLMADGFSELIINRGLPRLPYGENAFDDYYTTRRGSLSLNWKHQLNSQHSIQCIGAASDYRRIKNTYYRDLLTLEDQLVETAGSQDTSTFRLYMLRASVVRGGDSLRLKYEAGVDLNTETTSGQRIENQSQWMGDYAVFATAEYKPHKKVSLRGGLRYAYNTIFTSPLTPSLHARVDVTEHFFIRASYASGFRAPSLKELYFYFVDINHNIKGNENLRAEQSDNVIASLNWRGMNDKRRTLFSLTGFYNDIHNLITLALLSGTEYTYVNIGRYKTTGLSLTADLHTSKWHINAGVVYTGRYNVFSEGSSLAPFAWSPEARISAIWNTGWNDIALAAFYKYTGVTPGFSANENGEVFNTSIDDYHTADLTLSKKWIKGKLITEAGVRNLADVRNVQANVSGGAAHAAAGAMNVATGRQYFLSVRWILTYDKKEQ